MRRAERAVPVTLGWPPLELWPHLLLGSVLFGCAWVLATSEIGSGDYGQWLMTARPYLGESVPDYRSASAVPPVVPFLLAVVVQLVGDPSLGIHLFAVLLLVALGLSAYLAGSTIFGTRMAGLVTLVGALLLTDRFLELFAFGGLLQAGAIVFLWLGCAALIHAGAKPTLEWGWWTAGGTCIGLAAVTHVGTASIAVPTGIVVGLLSAMRVAPTWRPRLQRLAPLGVAVAVAGIYWLVFLLPGGTEFARNPASLAYRGPGRLLEAITQYW
nr:glycosyltransferase family 39 protein [Chloroflexota bacterium]